MQEAPNALRTEPVSAPQKLAPSALLKVSILWIGATRRHFQHNRRRPLADAATAGPEAILRQTRRLCSTAAAMKLANRGCGAKGRLFSSG